MNPLSVKLLFLCLISLSKVSAFEEDLDDDDDDNALQTDPVTGMVTYAGYKVIQVRPQSQQQLDILKFIAKGVDDIWSPLPSNISDLVQGHVELMLSSRHFGHVNEYLTCSGVPFQVTIEDVQKLIDVENIPEEKPVKAVGKPAPLFHYFASNPHRSRRQVGFDFILTSMFGETYPPSPPLVRQSRHFDAQANNNNQLSRDLCSSFFDWDSYHRIDRIYAYLDCLAFNYKDRVTLFNIGYSYENRPLKVIKIGTQNRMGKSIWMDGGIHAREWISPASVLYMISQLVERYDYHKDIVDNYDIYLLPVINPDGYEYTFTHNRMWRKTRSNPHGFGPNSLCVGTDPNRNWSYKWGGKGASQKPCSETYRGPRPFSESETDAVQQFIMPRKNEFKLFLTFHSYGQFILFPWGYERHTPSNSQDLEALADVAAEAMYRTGGHKYTIGSAARVLYPASGGSDDWAKGTAGIPYSYTIELPDTGRFGFLLPANRIKTTARETHAGVTQMIKALQNF